MAEVLGHDTRYNRQIMIPAFGREAQKALVDGSVGIVGAGGVKSSLLLLLAAAGVGHIRLFDYDRVELSNLNRQILYRTPDIGALKAEAAAATLRALNPDIVIEWRSVRLDEQNYAEHLADLDVLVEGGDGAIARLAFNRWAVTAAKPYVHASAQYNYAYVLSVQPGSACLQCAYPDLEAGPGGPVPVIGIATSIAGTIAAEEIINHLTGRGFNFTNRIWCHQGWSGETIIVPAPRVIDCPACRGRGLDI